MQVEAADETVACKVKKVIALHMGETLAESRTDLSDRAASEQTLLAARFGAASVSQLLDLAIAVARALRID